eukprot:2698130-Pyramimonas_sp.AAC.1
MEGEFEVDEGAMEEAKRKGLVSEVPEDVKAQALAAAEGRLPVAEPSAAAAAAAPSQAAAQAPAPSPTPVRGDKAI